MSLKKTLPPDLQDSKALTVYPTDSPTSTSSSSLSPTKTESTNDEKISEPVPHYHRKVARLDGTEDAEYYKDVNNITHLNGSNAGVMGLMIRLTAESIGYFEGRGELSIEDWKYIGARILYPAYGDEIKSAVFQSDRLKDLTLKLAVEELNKKGILPPKILVDGDDALRQQRTGLLGYFHSTQKTPNNAAILKYRLQLETQMNSIRQQILRYLNGLAADLSNKNMIKVGAFFVNNMLVRMYNQGIHIKESEFLEVRKVALEAERKKLPLIFLPCHKSHVDYVVISYMFYRLGIALPHIAAGDNLNIPLVGWILKHGGAFFLRRSFGDDPLYNEVFREYVELLLRRGHNIEVFIEGTRSRMGKLLNPKLGVLKIILDSVVDGRIEDAIFVPMSIGYDKVIETESYVSELLGTPKTKESLVGILNNANILQLKLGRIDIRFAKPFSLRGWIDEQVEQRSTTTFTLDPQRRKSDRALLLQSIGFRVLSDINSVSVVMPTALVGTVILTLRGRGVGFEELVRRVTWLRREILLKGGRVADFGGASVAEIVQRAITALSDTIGVRQNLLEPIYYATKRFELSLYRNQVIHLFVHEAFICAGMYSTIKKGRTHRRIFRETLLADILLLSKLLKKEFIFRPGPVESNLDKSVCVLYEHRVVDLESLDGTPVKIDVDPKQIWEEGKIPCDMPKDYFVRLSDRERAIGRENFDFYCFLIWPFLETYWLAAASLFCLVPTPKIGGVTEKELMDRVQHFAKTLYYEGDLGYFESINKETLMNAFKRYQEMGIMVSKQTTDNLTTPNQSGHNHRHNSPVTKKQVLFAVAPEYEQEALEFMSSASEKDFYAGIYEDGQQQPQLNSRGKNIYQTKLWDFVEQIGRFRREGKHRRDNSVSGMRTLRLARMTRDFYMKGSETAKI